MKYLCFLFGLPGRGYIRINSLHKYVDLWLIQNILQVLTVLLELKIPYVNSSWTDSINMRGHIWHQTNIFQ